eukprot:314095-Rhodomonas_salina.1
MSTRLIPGTAMSMPLPQIPIPGTRDEYTPATDPAVNGLLREAPEARRHSRRRRPGIINPVRGKQRRGFRSFVAVINLGTECRACN